jgi:uncharacterized protein (TIGR02679 family)
VVSGDGAVRFAGPEYKRLLDAARQSLERTGVDLTRTVTVKSPDDKERKAIIGITGQHRPESVAMLAVRLADLDDCVREATGRGLRELLEDIGPPLRDRPADRKRLADAREASVRSVENSFLNGREWFELWLAEIAADGTLTRLVVAAESGRVAQAVRVLERIDTQSESVQLTELAAGVTGDTKALDYPGTLGTLVLRGLAFRQLLPRPATTEQRSDLWDACGVIVDDLASRVLVLNLPAEGAPLGEWLTSAAAHGTPFYVTLQQLIAFRPVVREPVVYACENPAVLRRAAAELGPRAAPLLCAEGQPSTAFHRLVSAVTVGGGELRYHGDFDWPGISIAAGILARHNAVPWRLGVVDYATAIAAEGDFVALAGPPQPTPWDPELEAAMSAAERVLYEESVADVLMADLGADRIAEIPGPGPLGTGARDLAERLRRRRRTDW